MIDASILSELSALGLTAPQYQSVLSMLSRLMHTISEKEEEAKTAYHRGKDAERKRKNLGQSVDSDGFSPKEKSNPPFPPVAKATAQSMNDFVWLECPIRLQNLGLTERAARSNLGRWLKITKSPERVLEAVEAAERAGTRDPIPYITEALKPKVLAFSGDWEVGAARQIKARDEGPKITEEERQANLQKLAKIRFRGKGIDVKNG